jgi:hypothetical protein
MPQLFKNLPLNDPASALKPILQKNISELSSIERVQLFHVIRAFLNQAFLKDQTVKKEFDHLAFFNEFKSQIPTILYPTWTQSLFMPFW